MQVTDYLILKDDDSESLTSDVTTHLKAGWNLHGPLVIAKGVFYQTLIKVDTSQLDFLQEQLQKIQQNQ